MPAGKEDPSVDTVQDAKPIARADYAPHSKTKITAADWTASLVIVALICLTTFINLVYLIAYSNLVTVVYPNIYAGSSEVLYNATNSSPISDELVYTFISSEITMDTTHLVNALQGPPPSAPTANDNCFAHTTMGEESFVMCDNLNKSALPDWAQSFDALAVRTIYLSTPEEFRNGENSAFLGVMQAYKNNRTGWFNQKNAERITCTTQQLTQPSPSFVTRTIYTKTHGMLHNVNCSSDLEMVGLACRVTVDNPTFQLFDDKSGNPPTIQSYEVFRTSEGTDLILHPLLSKELIGMQTTSMPLQAVDGCTYIRDGRVGWFGMDYTTYVVSIPVIALIAKLELIGVVFVIWFVKYHMKVYRLHHALYQTSRLGIFIFLVVQILISAYYEQDIMRSIYSWERRDAKDWILFVYIELAIALTTTLVSLSIVRIIFESSMCHMGCMLSIGLTVPVAIIEVIIANAFYDTYNEANGLSATSTTTCDAGYTSCTVGTFNVLYLVIVVACFPSLVELIPLLRRAKTEGFRAPNIADIKKMQANQTSKPTTLTTFERVCLDGLPAPRIVWDLATPHVQVHDTPHTSAEVVSACGFTIIKNRFLIRTKDLVLILGAEMIPPRLLRDFSLVIWPIKANQSGLIEVQNARRVFLRRIRRFELDKNLRASLINSVEHPIA